MTSGILDRWVIARLVFVSGLARLSLRPPCRASRQETHKLPIGKQGAKKAPALKNKDDFNDLIFILERSREG